ncbi:ribosomal-processing cysteine protease Prp [Mesobacillus stamsii]|uniref:Ribosomal processing cysteine protease Prp n=1 Tax=Mesobacillus stamsii TaxID=225347 RepID=A0ABU0FXA1_9BACI|nr:ribosomal-processing cysteine protease Prp [Mesobacillus stamsii]MDQ0414557.1 uncharacterized protein YsxB (DUF464 family) [Mesobacillus stamsii]
MITATITRTKSGSIQSFTISGHAGYATKGSDIVCAGVSTISIGTVNSIIGLTGITPDIEQGADGFLRCEIPDNLSEDTQEKIQLLLESMVITLQSMEKEYGKHIKLTFKK